MRKLIETLVVFAIASIFIFAMFEAYTAPETGTSIKQVWDRRYPANSER